MMSWIKSHVFLLAINLLLISTACSQPTGDNELYFPTNTNNQELSASISYKVEDVEELYERADNVVVASVVGYEPYTIKFHSRYSLKWK